MNLNALKSISPALQYLKKDKVCLLLSSIPVLIGVLFYFLLGRFFFSTLIGKAESLVQQYISDGTFGDILYYLILAVMMTMVYFIVSWTFIMVISLISSPFNDLLSARIEKLMKGESPPGLNESFKQLLKNVAKTILNEIKKVSFILFLSILALMFSYIPILTPIGLFITVVLLAVGYLDYSWSRHSLSLKECRKDLRQNLFNYAFGGGMFMVLVTVPIVNLLVPSFATSYFTVLWVKNNERRS